MMSSNSSSISTVDYAPGVVRLLDQTRLPGELVVHESRDLATLIDAIRRLVVRGAPAIGVAAGHGAVLALELRLAGDGSEADAREGLLADLAALRAARPTAVNLMWAVDRMQKILEGWSGPLAELLDAWRTEARCIHEEDVELCRRMGEHGAALLPNRATILTHCNTGALATAGIGTALGVVQAAVNAGKKIRAYADETRPLLQGVRLTAWELERMGVEVDVLADGAAASILRSGNIDAVLVGSDRIAANGDVANKIGTYPLAVLAHRHDVPFYVVAPTSTVDLSVKSGDEIEIEMRDPTELHQLGGIRIAPEGVGGYNPAFDVTPADLVSAIVTETGVLRPPYLAALTQSVAHRGTA
jgi:methylthioribose-1-phosphate isomerase